MLQNIQKFQFLLRMFPQNAALRKIAQSRSLEVVDLTPDELKQVEDSEEQLQEQLQQQAKEQTLDTGTPAPIEQPQQESSQVVNEIQEGLATLAQ